MLGEWPGANPEQVFGLIAALVAVLVLAANVVLHLLEHHFSKLQNPEK